MKRTLEIVGWLAGILIFAFATHSAFAQEPRTQGDAAAGRGHEQHGRARGTRDVEDINPMSIARAARTLYVRPSEHVDARYLEYKLQKKSEFREWGLMIVEDERAADLVLKVEKTALNYVFRLVDPETSVVVVSGKVVAINKLVAAEYLGTEIIKKLKSVRAASDNEPARKKKKQPSQEESEDDDEWSES